MNLNHLRRQIIKATTHAGSGHIPSAFSVLEIIWTLYNRVLREGDRFILSKGHGALTLYAVLAERGVISEDELEKFGTSDGILGGHPDALRVPGVEASTGSLGHGLAFGAGIALAKRLKGEPGRVFVLVGDGECMEGSVYEAAAQIKALDLNVVVIVDDNYSHRNANPVGLFEGLNWAMRYCQGNDVSYLESALDGNGPLAIICNTVKGYGSATLTAEPNAWHNRAPNVIELGQLLGELE